MRTGESKLLPAGVPLAEGGVKVANREIDGFMRPANASRDHLRPVGYKSRIGVTSTLGAGVGKNGATAGAKGPPDLDPAPSEPLLESHAPMPNLPPGKPVSDPADPPSSLFRPQGADGHPAASRGK